jgi:2-dehydropantoate 2-reductase
MKICIYGAGAIGSHLAARLSAAGKAEVSVIARGAQLEAIRANGITLKSGKQEIHGRPAVATDDPRSLPKQDVVFVTLKSHAASGVAAEVERLLAPDGCAVFPLNGLTWWWRYGRGAKQGPLPLLDPEGELWNRLRERTLGCVVYSPNEIVSPGVVAHVGGNRFVIGEPSDQKTARAQAVVDLFNASGITAEVSPDIRAELLRKFVGNAWSNPLGALTQRFQYDVAQDPELKRIAVQLMRETLDVAAALGWDLRGEIDADSSVSRSAPGGATPSMLQDVRLGRGLEVEAHLGQTQAFARELGVPVPTIDVVLPLLRGLDASLRAGRA